jgi:Replication initiator protein A
MNESTLPESVSEDSIEALRVETALSRFPIHSLTTGEVKIDYKNLGRATEWRVSHNATYGAPGALAYKLDTLVVNKRIEQGGRPVPQVLRLGSLNDIAKEMGTNVSGKSLANIKNALLQNAFTGITAKMSYKTRDGEEREIEIADTRYGVVFTGDKLPSGQKADGVYLLLHDFYREILNFAQSRPLDYTYMKSLTPMAQRFYEIVSYAIYAALLHKNKSCKMRYSEFCKLATTSTIRSRSRCTRFINRTSRAGI